MNAKFYYFLNNRNWNEFLRGGKMCVTISAGLVTYLEMATEGSPGK